jgi:hypothetical protein
VNMNEHQQKELSEDERPSFQDAFPVSRKLRMTFLLIGQNNMKLWVMYVCSLIGR